MVYQLMTNDMRPNLLTPCDTRTLQHNMDPNKDARNLSGRDCNTSNCKGIELSPIFDG
jgi:hypothetical protein